MAFYIIFAPQNCSYMNSKIYVLLFLIAGLLSACDPHKKVENPAVLIKDAVTDVDGNTYDAALIGGHLWMASNLKTTHYADGEPIAQSQAQYSDSVPYYYLPQNELTNVERYGLLYNWMAAVKENRPTTEHATIVQGVCPDGWHLPTYNDWKALADTVKLNKSYTDYSGSVAKAMAATVGWDSSIVRMSPGRDFMRNGATGFNAMPAGCFNFGNFVDLGTYAHYWTATRVSENSIYAVSWNVGYDKTNPTSHESSLYCGFSVRCVQD